MTTDQAAALVRAFKIGKRLRVTFTAPPPRRGAVLAMTAEWEPDLPAGLSRRERRDYEAARLAFVAELSQLMAPSGG